LIKSFKADKYANTILKDQISNLALLPTIYEPLLEGFPDFDEET